ncbi:MAG: VapE domain-containing protein [Bacteroidota bacterium]
MKDFKGKLKNQFNYIGSNYQFRFNVVTSSYEYRKYIKGKAKESGSWVMYSDRVRGDILIEMMEKDLDIAKDKFDLFIESELVSPDYNPFLEYFENLPAWDGKTDHLKELCRTVVVTNQNHFETTMKKFLIGTLDCLLERDAVNDVCLVFQSPQGVGKSRWMRSLLPKQFQQDYLYEGNIDTKNKDHTIYLSQYWFIHLDELEAFKGNDISAIKSFITRQRISTRKAYGRYTSHFERRASFLGSVNDDKFLTDITGNRRWLVFITKEINYEHRVFIDGLWAQVYHYWKEGFKHWFDIEEIKEINQINEEFRNMSLEEEQLLQMYDFCKKGESGNWLSSTDVLMEIGRIRPALMNKMNSRNIGKALSKHCPEKKMSGGVQKYFCEMKPSLLTPTDPNQQELGGANKDEEHDDLPF